MGAHKNLVVMAAAQLVGVDPTNPGRLYAVTDKSAILASQDGGKTWKLFGS